MSNDPRSSVAGAPEPDLSDTPRESRRASTGQGTVRSKGAPLWSWPQRLVRASALLLFVMSGIVWMRPVNIPGRNLQPFGCGSAANPMTGPLAEIHCMDAIGSSRALALCLLIGAGLLLGIGESLVARFPSYSARMALAASTGVPLAAFGAWKLVAPIATYGGDGEVIQCGTALAPTGNQLARGICAGLPAATAVDGFVLVAGGLGAAIAVFFVIGWGRQVEMPQMDDDQ